MHMRARRLLPGAVTFATDARRRVTVDERAAIVAIRVAVNCARAAHKFNEREHMTAARISAIRTADAVRQVLRLLRNVTVRRTAKRDRRLCGRIDRLREIILRPASSGALAELLRC